MIRLLCLILVIMLLNLDRYREGNLGGTLLDRHPILNPVPDYRYNRYLNREVNAKHSTFQTTGNNIIS
jgi:hypothetical protein